MAICCAVGCANRSDCSNHNEVSFHRFPKDPDMQHAWTLAVKRQNWQPSVYTVLCGDHFEDSCYVKKGKNKILLEKASPTLFLTHIAENDKVVIDSEVPVEKVNIALSEAESAVLSSEESENEEKYSGKEECFDVTENVSESNDRAENTSISSGETSIKLPGSAPYVCYISKSVETAVDSNAKLSNEVLKRKLEAVSAENLIVKKKLKCLQQTHQRYVKKIAKLEEVINSFENYWVTDDNTMDILNSIPAPDRERLLHQLCTNQSKALLGNDVQELSCDEYISDASNFQSDNSIDV